MKKQQASLALVAQSESILDSMHLNHVRAGLAGSDPSDPYSDPYQYDPNLTPEENEIQRTSRRTRAIYEVV